MRICNKCHVTKSIDQFYGWLTPEGKRKFRYDCIPCHKLTMKLRCAEHYQNNKSAYAKRARAQEALIRNWIRNFKVANNICADCKLPHPFWRLDFDHVVGKKLFNVSQMCRVKPSMKAVQAEIAKCELVCANCHRDRTYTRLSA